MKTSLIVSVSVAEDSKFAPVMVEIIFVKFNRATALVIDQRFANKAVEAGATLVTGIRVDDLIWEQNRITAIAGFVPLKDYTHRCVM